MNGKDARAQAQLIGKQNQQDTLFDELLREKAVVLSRAGFAVEDALNKIMKIGQRLDEQIAYLNHLHETGASGEKKIDKSMIFEQINSVIDEYNEACRKADLKYYYLIVTREAMGLRRHETVRQLYLVPPKKKKLQAI